MNQNDFLKTFNTPGSLDLNGLNDLNKKIQHLKNNPKEDTLEQLLELRSNLQAFIKLAPPLAAMLNPYLNKVNVGIKQLQQIKNDEQK